MADIKTPEERSRNMAAIKGKDTKPEVYLRKLLFSKGYRYRKNCPQIIGHPDIWLAKFRTAIFVHGCYWHRHPGCRFAYTPKSNVVFWSQKFEDNISRDNTVKEKLLHERIKCVIVWECTVKQMQKDSNMADISLSRIITFFDSENLYLEL